MALLPVPMLISMPNAFGCYKMGTGARGYGGKMGRVK
jgi:hypothetical protein